MRNANGLGVAVFLGFVGLTSALIAQSQSMAQASGAPVTSLPKIPPLMLWGTPLPPGPATRVWVRLNGPDDLEHLRQTNPDHYQRAARILSVANEICQPETSKVEAILAKFSGEFPSCQSWMTSYPPKTLLRFHLDDVGYIALVSVPLDVKPVAIAKTK